MERELPLVSIVTPSYNQGAFIEETILSVKNQTYPNIEHIIMDGGSTDDTLDIIRKYESTYNMHWVSEPDNGQSDAINKGWQKAKGEILGWLNSDDTYMPWAVDTAVKFLSEHPDASLVYGDCNIIDEQSEVAKCYKAGEFDLKRLLCVENMIPQPAAFLRRQVLDITGFLDIDLYFAMDYDFWIRIAVNGLKLEYIPQCLANFRKYPSTKTVSGGLKKGLENLHIIEKTFSNPELPGEVKVLRGQAYSRAHFKLGMMYYGQGQMKPARKHLIKAIKLNPANLVNRGVMGCLVTSLPGGRAIKRLVKPGLSFVAPDSEPESKP